MKNNYEKPKMKRIVSIKKQGNEKGMCKRCGCATGSSSGG